MAAGVLIMFGTVLGLRLYQRYERAQEADRLFAAGQFKAAHKEVKILFFDEDRMLAHMGIKEEIRLNSFYLAWFDEWRGQIYNFYRPQFISGEIEGLHTVYVCSLCVVRVHKAKILPKNCGCTGILLKFHPCVESSCVRIIIEIFL